MPGSFELVLALEASAASEWMAAPAAFEQRGGTIAAAPKRAGRGVRAARARLPERGDIGAAVADALSRMPDIVEVQRVQDATVQAFAAPDGARCVRLTIVGERARRAAAVRASAFAPGVRQCETICDEPLAPGADLSSADALPPSIGKALGKAGRWARSPALSARLGTWRWTGADGVIVDVELHEVRGASSDMAFGATAAPPEYVEGSGEPRHEPGESAAPPIAFCELRLVSRIDAVRARGASPLRAAVAAAESTQTDTAISAGAADDAADSDAFKASADWSLAALDALFAAAGVLADVLPVFPTLVDGYVRACTRERTDEAVRAARVDLSHACSPHDALIEACSSITRQWFGNETGVRDGAGPEFVHQMRVALRRLKTLLKTFPRWIDDAWARTIAPDLDWLGTLLGHARDLDVFVDTTLPVLVQADVETASWSSLQAGAAARRDEARSQAAAALRTRRYALLSLTWLRWLAMHRISSGPVAMADKPLADYAAKRVRKHYKRLLAKPGLTSLTPAERHRRRIEAKRLRYTLEFFESLVSRKTRRKTVKQLSRIQSVLGDGSDAATALRFLEALDVPPYEHGFARGWCEAVNRWSAVEGERLVGELGKPKVVREG